MAKRNLGAEQPTAEGLLQRPHDPYWDSSISRREVQEAVNQLAENDRVLSMQNDTTNIVMNFLCEKIGVKREEIDKWVAEKKKVIEMQQKGILKPDENGDLKAVIPPESSPAATQEENATQSSNS